MKLKLFLFVGFVLISFSQFVSYRYTVPATDHNDASEAKAGDANNTGMREEATSESRGVRTRLPDPEVKIAPRWGDTPWPSKGHEDDVLTPIRMDKDKEEEDESSSPSLDSTRRRGKAKERSKRPFWTK